MFKNIVIHMYDFSNNKKQFSTQNRLNQHKNLR